MPPHLPSVLVVWPAFGVSLGLLGADEDGGGGGGADDVEEDGIAGGGVLLLDVLLLGVLTGMLLDVLGGKLTLEDEDETLPPLLQVPNCALHPLPQ